MRVRTRNIALASSAALGSALLMTACQSSSAPADGTIALTSTDTACEISVATAPAGVIQFQVTNSGSQVTEVYVLASDGVKVLAELENVGPGITRNLVTLLPPGSYKINCKPGMAGDGITTAFTVTETSGTAAPSVGDPAAVDAATTAYASYVKKQSQSLLTGTKQFADAYRSGNDDEARALYAPTRMYWESIEPVAESFGDLDPILDAREADLATGEAWTGWHRIEKDLWPPASGYTPLTKAQRTELADGLVKNTTTLVDRTKALAFTIDQLGNGAKELLDEVATGKITGEEEIWSHTDLWDFQANIDGARVMYEGLRPVILGNDPELATTLDTEFTNVQAQLDKYRQGDGFVSYADLTASQIKELATAVDALSEPLSHITSVALLGKRQSP